MQKPTIYLNHAGTSWPKPKCVVAAVDAATSLDPTGWPAAFRNAHQAIAALFHVEAARLLLTPSCTAALGLAIADHDWQAGDRVLTSGYEHHALNRPLVQLRQWGVDIVTIPGTSCDLLDLEALEAALKSAPVRLVAITAACNVTGQLLPITEVIELAHNYGALVLVDGAQIAGWWDLDVTELKADLFAFAGHKGPQAPWGIGGLYVAPHVLMNSPRATCALTDAQSPARCAPMPGYCDAGSVNMLATLGMAAASEWLGEPAQADRLERARNFAGVFSESIRELPGVSICGDVPLANKMPTVAITAKTHLCTDLAHHLVDRGLIASGGFQCAPEAHQSLGTDRTGVLRFSFGATNHASDVDDAVQLMRMIVS